MASKHEPLVSVVTPVYNGEAYLSDCIESVISQTYERWEYVILDNCSTDRTFEIAQRHASVDSRIRVFQNDELLEITPNWNRALRKISPESDYCKVLHADDCLFPDCISAMVEVAERHPNIAIVGAYRLDGCRPMPSPGLPHDRSVFPGMEICRGTLRNEYSLFGSPSSLLVRSGLVRERECFYDEAYLHADKAVGLELLQKWDFGFIPELLTFTRIHDESQSVNLADRYGTRVVENFLMLKEFGPQCLSLEECQKAVRATERRYYRFLVSRVVHPRGRDVLRFHKRHLRKHDCELSISKLGVAGLVAAVDRLLDPRELARRIGRSVKSVVKRGS